MKKLISLALVAAFTVSLGVGCSSSSTPPKAPPAKVGGGDEKPPDKGAKAP